CVEPLLSPARVYLDTVPARSHPRHRDVAAHVDTFEHGLDRHLWADESRLRIEHGDLVIRYYVCGVQAPDLGSVEDLRIQGVLPRRLTWCLVRLLRLSLSSLLLLNGCDRLAGLDRLALAHQQLLHRAGDRRRDLRVDLVSPRLDERLSLIDVVA